jgi:hypothetical protein
VERSSFGIAKKKKISLFISLSPIDGSSAVGDFVLQEENKTPSRYPWVIGMCPTFISNLFSLSPQGLKKG